LAELKHEIEVAQLSAQLENLKTSVGFKEKTPELSDRFSAHEQHTMGLHMFAKQKRDEYAERFKDDPELLEQANEGLNAFVDQELVRADESK
jgi:hypothetical protein